VSSSIFSVDGGDRPQRGFIERLLGGYWEVIERLLGGYWEVIERLLRGY